MLGGVVWKDRPDLRDDAALGCDVDRDDLCPGAPEGADYALRIEGVGAAAAHAVEKYDRGVR